MDYQNTIKEIKSNLPILKDEIFDYQDTPLEQEFDETFTFYKETLTLNKHFGIEPAYIYFNNGVSVNARAAKIGQYFIISINMGTIKGLMDMFLNNNTLLNDTNNDDFIQFEKFLDLPIKDLMYQNAVHFTFYHEMAHLIQKSEYLNTNLYEHSEHVSEYSLFRHNLEFDADEFSALNIGAHAYQFAIGTFGKNITTDQLEKILVLVLSSTLLYLFSFPSNREQLYFESHSHPHPIIRVIFIARTIIDYFNQLLAYNF